MNNNLSLIGYRMPAEWELQEGVWIAWPYNKSDWPGLFKNIPKIIIVEPSSNFFFTEEIILRIVAAWPALSIDTILLFIKY